MHHILAQYRFEGIFGFVCAEFPQKLPLNTVLYPSPFYSKIPSFGGVFLNKKHPTHVKTDFSQKKMENLVKNTFVI